jgi:hypothetical protein
MKSNVSCFDLTSKLNGNVSPFAFSHLTGTFDPTDDVQSTSILSPGLTNDLEGFNFKNGIGAKIFGDDKKDANLREGE